MTHKQYKAKYLGKSLGNPRTGTYKGQCVSATRRYMEEVLGVRTAVWGHAKDYWTNPEVLKRFDKVKSPKTGDIVVYGANPSNVYGHIGMYDGGKLLSSNYDVPLHLTVASLNYPNRLGYLRKKGSSVDKKKKVSHYRANQIAQAVLFRGMGKEEFNKYHKNKTEYKLFEDFRKSKEHKNKKAKLKKAGDPTSNDAEVRSNLITKAIEALRNLKG